MGKEGETSDAKRPRSRSRSRTRVKSHKNPYLNFLRDFRQEHSPGSGSARDLVVRAGEIWRNMPMEEKQPYIDEAGRVARDSQSSKKKSAKVSKQKSSKKAPKKQPPKRRKYQDSEESDDDTSVTSNESD